MASIYESFSIQNVSTKGPLTLTRFGNILTKAISCRTNRDWYQIPDAIVPTVLYFDIKGDEGTRVMISH